MVRAGDAAALDGSSWWCRGVAAPLEAEVDAYVATFVEHIATSVVIGWWCVTAG